MASWCDSLENKSQVQKMRRSANFCQSLKMALEERPVQLVLKENSIEEREQT